MDPRPRSNGRPSQEGAVYRLPTLLKEGRPVKDELRQAIDTIPGFVWSALPDGSVDFLNQRWCDYTGVSLQDASGRGWQSAIHPEDLPQLVDYWSSLLNGREPGEFEARLRRSDGHVSVVLDPGRAVVRRARTRREVVWPEHRHRRSKTSRDPARRRKAVARNGRLGLRVADCPGRVCAPSSTRPPAVAIAASCWWSLMRSTVRHAAAPTLPSEFSHAIDGRSTSVPYWGPCAMAIDQKTPVIVSDIGQDARWDNFEWCRLALAVGLRSCWTTPILSQAGSPLGTFAIYQREVGEPTPAADRPHRAIHAHCQHCGRARTSRRGAQTEPGAVGESAALEHDWQFQLPRRHRRIDAVGRNLPDLRIRSEQASAAGSHA